MIIFNRDIEPKIKELLFKRRAILIFGPRQAGKTTLAKKLIEEFGDDGGYYNCEEEVNRKNFKLGEPDRLKSFLGEKKIVVFDEAQTIQNIGSILKVFIDKYPDVQIIATGSSSFDLANKINEPLTGRSFEFLLYPLSLAEIKKNKKVTRDDLLEYMRLGMYPAVAGEEKKEIRENLLKNITTNYLYKDVYIFESIRNPELFENMLRMLAIQTGQLISVNEIANSLRTSRTTVEKYLRLLEQSYIIKKITSFSNNYRNELKKAFKIYFLDLGIRNILADNLDPMDKRLDKGFVLENMFFLELVKKFSLDTFPPNIFFWRTVEKMEIDFIVRKNQEIKAYECKWTKEQVPSSIFKKYYPKATFEVVSLEDFLSE